MKKNKKAKKFVARLKNKDADPSRKSPLPSITGNLTPTDCLIAYVKAQDLPEFRDKYQALLGEARPVDLAIASNRILMAMFQDAVEGPLREAFAEQPSEIGFQVTRVATCPLRRIDFSVEQARKAAATYRRLKVDGLAAVRICPFVDPRSGEAKMAMVCVAIFGGPGSRQKVEQSFGKARAQIGIERSPMAWIPSGDHEGLRTYLDAIFAAPLTALPRCDPLRQEGGKTGKGSGPGDRALLTLMCRSQLPMRKMLVYFGAGKHIVAGAMGKIDHALREQCRGTPDIVHRDEIPHLWYSEIQRQVRDDLAVPIIRLS